MEQVEIVSASAGSGKTYKLTFEYIKGIISAPDRYRHTLAVTFTNKATAEMKKRILDELNSIAREKEGSFAVKIASELHISESELVERARLVQNRILHDYSHFAVLTIDKFFQRILRSFLHELSIDINFNIELQDEALLDAATSQMLSDVATDGALREWIMGLVEDRIDDSVGWNVHNAIAADGKIVLNEDYRIREHKTSREELLQKVKQLKEQANNAKKTIIESAAEIVRIMRDNALTEDDILKNIISWVNGVCEGELKDPSESKTVMGILDGEKEWFKKGSYKKNDNLSNHLTEALNKLVERYNNSVRLINTADILRAGYRRFALMSDLKQRIERVEEQEKQLLISETSELLSKMISDSDAPFILEKVGNRFTHYLLDEFQDTSLLQWRNFLPLLRNAVSQNAGKTVLLVGDTKQAIYRWRGGDYAILAKEAPQAFDNTALSTLQYNRRSRREIVEFNNRMIESAVSLGNDELNTLLDEALNRNDISEELHDELYGELKKAYADYRQIPVKDEGGYVTVRQYDVKTEPELVVDMVEQLQERGFRARDIAILVRTNRDGEQIANMLLSRKSVGSRYNYDVITQKVLVLGHSALCKFVVSVLQLTLNGNDDIQRAIYNRFLGRQFNEVLPDEDTDFMMRMSFKSPEEIFNETVLRYHLNEEAANTAWLQAIEEQILRFTGRNIADTELFVKWWNAFGSSESLPMPADADAITIDTIHKSKGLGYEVVIIPCCNWSMTSKHDTCIWTQADKTIVGEMDDFPVKFEKRSARSAFSNGYYRETVLSYIDGMNMFYVALTRAKQELHIMFPKRKEQHNGIRYIDEVITKSLPDISSEMYECGAAAGREKSTDEAERSNETEYPDFVVEPVSERVAMSLASQRYFEEETGGDLSPRNYGILMHSLFSSAETAEQLYAALDRLRADEGIDDGEKEQLKRHIDDALTNPVIAEWFSNVWERVMNEASIVTPSAKSWRPDRVMISGSRAVVVDYKFGRQTNDNNSVQVREYMELLKEMGYEPTGYVWYVNLNVVNSVEQYRLTGKNDYLCG